MPKIKVLIIATFALVATSVANAVSVVTEAGVSYAIVSGVRSYAAPDLTHSDTSSLAIPFVRISTGLSEDWRVGFGYSYIGGLKASGTSPNSNIFRDPSLTAVQVITPFRSTEDIHEFSLDARYSLLVADALTLQVGPVGSLFYSRARIAGRTFTATEVKIGAVAELRYDLTPEWQLMLGCRYSRPKDRDTTQFYVSAGYRL